jgi:multicomponent Na+:H+ antiporter subunit G
MSAVDWLAAAALVAGGFFYLAGTVGLLRFPDALSRLHALTKADNVGLMLVCLGLALLDGSWRTAALLMLIWLLAMLAATVSAHLIARRALADQRAAAPTPSGEAPR